MTQTRKTLIVIGIVLLLLLVAAPLAAKAYSRWNTIRVLWRVHDEVMLPNPEGRRYIQLFWEFNDDLSRMIVADEGLRDQSWDVIQRYVPYLEALVDGRGSEIILSAEDVEAIESILLHYAEKGDQELREAITEELLLKDTSAMIGMNIDQATEFMLLPADGRELTFSYQYIEIYSPAGFAEEGPWPELKIGGTQFWRGIPKDGTLTTVTFPMTISQFNELPEGAPIWTVEAEPRYFGELHKTMMKAGILRLTEQTVTPTISPTSLPTQISEATTASPMTPTMFPTSPAVTSAPESATPQQ